MLSTHLRITSFVTTVAALLLLVLDQQPDAYAAFFGLLVVATLVALAARCAAVRVETVRPRRGPAGAECRLRGAFRRQHRPDSPGRPMPRAPGSVF